MSCRVALLRMQADGLFTLPPPRNAKPVAFRVHPDIERAVLEPTQRPAGGPRLSSAVELVVKKCDSSLWNAYIERHHYLGHQLLPGAQLRYFVRAAGQIIAVLGFGASAWKTKPRDEIIGWTTEQRRAQSAPHRQQRSLPDPAVDPLQKPRLAHPGLDQPTPGRGLARPLRVSSRSAGNLR